MRNLLDIQIPPLNAGHRARRGGLLARERVKKSLPRSGALRETATPSHDRPRRFQEMGNQKFAAIRVAARTPFDMPILY
jgi:hypothetical protein